MNLYNKYRPQSFEEVIGNEEAIVGIEALLEKKQRPHVFLLTGPTGCGKTTIARIIANNVGASEGEIIELDSAQFRGIDTIRDLRKQSQYKPLDGDTRVWIIDEVHQLSKDAQNAMLKSLEDTPDHIYYILCTTDPQKLLPTIIGRCSHHIVSTLQDKELMRLIRNVVKGEGEKLTKQVYEQIMGDSLGHPRNAIQILEKVLSVPEEQRLSVAQKTAEEQNQSIELCRALMRKAGWKEIALILKGLKDQDPEGIRRHILGYLQGVLLSKRNDGAAEVMEEFLEPFYASGFPGLVFACYSAVNAE
jgi:DNA polymerase III gamma/tau subunit